MELSQQKQQPAAAPAGPEQPHVSAVVAAGTASAASISSEGSTESQTALMEQEDIAVLTHDVRNFKEALGKLRRTLNPEQEKIEPWRVVAHERLGEVLRILRNVLEKYPALQSSELLLSASTLIQHVKRLGNEESGADPKHFFELIDQLALAFSSRVSEYLMGDLDTNILLSNFASNKTKSYENIGDNTLGSATGEKKNDEAEQLDVALLNLEQGVEFALNRAKIWAKYAKDILMYIEKRCHLEMEYARNLNKLALTVRPLISEEINIPFQSIYCTALDYDMENSTSSQATCSLLLGSRFLEPLSERRTEHEKERRQLKEQWFREVARMHDIIVRMRRARALYVQWQREAGQSGDEDAAQKALEIEAAYKASVSDANESHKRLYVVKNDVLQRVRALLSESDTVLQTVTLEYFQLQHTLNAPSSMQFQTLCESSRLYEPGSQYLEAVKRLPPPITATMQTPFTFEKYSENSRKILDQERKSTDSIEGEDLMFQGIKEPVLGSDTDSIASAASSHDADTSPSAGCRSPSRELISELDTSTDNGVGYVTFHPSHRHSMSKAAETHSFRKLKTPSKCRECDSYVYFQGVDCSECGLACHKKCLETLAIQCGHKRLPRKMTTFGVDLAQHLGETSTLVPHIVCKCIDEIDARGRLIKGIYRVSGVKSKVEKLCQAFETGAELVDLTDIHPNVIANVLKLYLRQLPEPLLTFRLYPEFVRIAKECPSNSPADVSVAREDLKELVRKLSRPHYLTLALLMLHLKRVSNSADVNNMPPSNLGVVFGPTLLRTAEGSASLSSLVDTVHQTRAIELLIMHSEEIFNSQEVAAAREHSLKMVRPTYAESSLLGRSFSFMDRCKKGKDHESSTCSAHEETDFLYGASDELSYFLMMDGPARSKTSPQLNRMVPTPKIFKGSLKDYQGLEGLTSLGMWPPDDSEIKHQKLKKKNSEACRKEHNTSTEISESVSMNRCLLVSKKRADSEKANVITSSAEECAESRASSVESRSPRETDDGMEVFRELPSVWPKKSSPTGFGSETRPKLVSGDSPSSSLSRSLDDSQGSDVPEDMDMAIRRSMATMHTSRSRTHFVTTSAEQPEIYIPIFQKQSHSQDSSEVCMKQSTFHCTSKSTVSCSNIDKRDIVTLKNQFLGFKDEENSIRNAHQMVMAAALTSEHCTKTKTGAPGRELQGTSKQLTSSHKEDSSIHAGKVTRESLKSTDHTNT